jgi:hypothetical protein
MAYMIIKEVRITVDDDGIEKEGEPNYYVINEAGARLYGPCSHGVAVGVVKSMNKYEEDMELILHLTKEQEIACEMLATQKKDDDIVDRIKEAIEKYKKDQPHG